MLGIREAGILDIITWYAINLKFQSTMHKIYKLIFCLVLTSIISLNLRGQESREDGMHVITDDQIKLYTKRSGNGPTAIFIHGGPGAWSKSFEVLRGENLESHLSMIYYDQRGCGRSSGSESDNYSLVRMVKDIELIRQSYNADSIYLIAHSFGGILAVNYALRYPSHVKGIILANSTLDILYSIQNQIHYMNSLLKTDYRATDSSQIIPTFKKVQSEVAKAGLIYKLLSDNKNNIDLLHKVDKQNPSEFAFARKALTIGDYLKDYSKITNQINLPVLIIIGMKDHAIGEKHFESFNFPNQTIKKINGGHLLYYEKNEDFISAILKYIRQREGTSANDG